MVKETEKWHFQDRNQRSMSQDTIIEQLVDSRFSGGFVFKDVNSKAYRIRKENFFLN